MSTVSFVFGFLALGIIGAKALASFESVPSYQVARGEGQKIEMIICPSHEFLFAKLKLALFGAFFLAFPLIAYQVYKFRGARPLPQRTRRLPALPAVDFPAVSDRGGRPLFRRHATRQEVPSVDGAGARQRVSLADHDPDHASA